jgi:molecular chaperone GrpE
MQGEEKQPEQDVQAGNNAAREAGEDGVLVSEQGAGAAESSAQQKLAELEAKVGEMQDAFLRAKADTENIRRRAQDDIARAHKFAIESFAETLMPVKDSLEMALKIEVPTLESLKEGVEMTLRQLTSAFEKGRLVELNPQPGEKLDPMKHQAMSTVPAEQEANTIVTVLQKGYTIADRLLRPALVIVAQEKSS